MGYGSNEFNVQSPTAVSAARFSNSICSRMSFTVRRRFSTRSCFRTGAVQVAFERANFETVLGVHVFTIHFTVSPNVFTIHQRSTVFWVQVLNKTRRFQAFG
jgi:hypothetical protein